MTSPKQARSALLVAAILGCGVACSTNDGPEPGVASGTQSVGRPPHVRVVETEPLKMDGIFHSMQGPFAWMDIDESNLDWVTGYKTEIIDVDTDEALGGEFFCHSSINQLNGTRLFVNATGTEELNLPEGFGMPVAQILSGLPREQRKLRALGMVLNNHVADIDRDVKVRVSMNYYTDEEVGSPPKLTKLYNTGLPLLVEDLEAYVPESGPPVPDDVTTHCVLVGGFNGHWIVPPGPQTTRQAYTDFLPVDGTVHYIVVHLHNYGKYMRLTDTTTGEVLWQAEPVYSEDPVQIVEIPVYSSREGFPIYKDRTYEIEAFYDNTSGGPVDAMAMMSIFYHPAGDEDIIYPQAPPLGPPS